MRRRGRKEAQAPITTARFHKDLRKREFQVARQQSGHKSQDYTEEFTIEASPRIRNPDPE